jgi:glycosyltransferase involved in cell wall biosynthesis
MARLTEFASKGECTIGVGRPYALAAWAIDHLPHAFSFYDAMDDFPAFYRGLSLRSVARWETQVAKRVDRVFCSSHALLQQFQEKGCTTELLLNGYSMTSLPERSPTGSNIIGYIGTISTWFDWPMVIEMAAALPETTVRLIGPELVRRPPFLPANIEILSECDQSMAIKHVSKFDVGLIPFVRNRLTRSVDPIKYYEYRSLGLPVWSSDFGEMSWRDGHDGVVKIKSGLNWRNLWQHRSELVCSPEQLAEFRRKYDWNVRFSQLASCIGY